MIARARAGVTLLALVGCAGATAGRHTPTPAAQMAVADSVVAVPLRDRARVAAAASAYRSGWMPLDATGVTAFRQRHPDADGRGVLIAILDSGIDPTIPGLVATSTGARKILDLRDFSGEGNVRLADARVADDSIEVGGRWLAGAARVLGRSVTGKIFGGVVAEIPFGTPRDPVEGESLPSDLNGNGRLADTLPVVVTQTAAGWGLFTDTNGDGSLADERPVLDYQVARESFGWHTGDAPAPMGVVVNVRDGADADGPPVLDLYVNTSAHGSHVAGIAAGHDIYGVAGFDGVAPGAQLLGLKIANNGRGGVSVTGSMAAAIAYAIDYAARYRLPLVINLSFGVGNEREGTARIDAVVDSILGLHPDVVFVVSAGNDGPGLSTVGFPASAERGIAVGGSFPLVFLKQPAAGPVLPDPIAFFSSRGGELGKPDVVAPSVAYSTVPVWDTGNERNAGTSMAAPHVAGVAALLISALREASLPYDAALLKRALTVTARPLRGTTVLDDGAGLVDLPAAYRWLTAGVPRPVRPVVTRTHLGILGDGAPGPIVFHVPLPSQDVVTSSDASWLGAVGPVAPAGPALGTVAVAFDSTALASPGLHTGSLFGWTGDRSAGPVFRLVTSWIRPYPSARKVSLPATPLAPGDTRRVFFRAEVDRPFQVRVASASVLERLFTSLHEPGGRPYRGENGLGAGPREEAAVYHLDARDVQAGLYEVDAVASPVYPGTAAVEVEQAAFRMAGYRNGRALIATVANVESSPAEWLPRAALIGAATAKTIRATGGAEQRVVVPIPAWATRVEIDVAMDPNQWSRFTDFGVALLDEAGRIIEDAPLDYAFGRLTAVLVGGQDIGAELALLPGFADPDPQGEWRVAVGIRFYAPSHVALQVASGTAAGSAHRLLPAGATDSVAFSLPESPWPLPPDYVSLGVVVVDTDGPSWTREVPLGADPVEDQR